MTIAIAASVPPFEHIVTVSDARLSHGEIIPAADDAAIKNFRFARRWGAMFAAEDSTAFIPVVGEARAALARHAEAPPMECDFDEETIRGAIQTAYEKEFNERFFREHLARFGYANVVDFRQRGFAEMGKELYSEYAYKLARFDLGLELLIYGFEDAGVNIFEVANPGKIISHNLRGFAAIGSGSLMAIAALNRKPLTPDLSQTIYRLLDAKFSSETARDVGRRTHVIILSKAGKVGYLLQRDVDQIRSIWERTVKQPEPEDAIKIIDGTSAVKTISNGGQ
jgi:hypothetical protein